MTHLNGPVPTTSTAYAERKFETDALGLLLNREWVLILGPRQHGKTSALLRICAAVKDVGFHCAFVDLQQLPPAPSFAQLCGWFARKIAASLGTAGPDTPADPEDLSAWLQPLLPPDAMPMVVVIDEASAVRDDAVRHAFLGHIRSFKTAGAVPGAWESRLIFAFAGTFRPEKMIDERNSPFNVCRRLEPEDLTIEQVSDLILDGLGERDMALAELICEHVGGQPHLVQVLIDAAQRRQEGTPSEAAAAHIQAMLENGSEHTDSLLT